MISVLIKKNKYIIIAISITVIVISASIGIFFLTFNRSNLHAPIIVESDDDFLNYDFSGNGTQDNPYMIDGFRIGASGEYSEGISISNTNSFFVIKNCLIYTDYIEIVLRDVAAGVAWIINNTCISKTGRGGAVSIDNTNNWTILGNSYKNLMLGIHLNYASYCLIKLNIIEDNNYQGINIRYSSNNIIFNNTIKACPQHGIALVGDANWNRVYNNILFENAYSATYNIDGRLTGTINSQAFDEGNNNMWYDDINTKGNYWSNYQGIGNYSIDGPAGTEDIYPQQIN